MGEDYLEIPYDVLFQILLRLPVKSLVSLARVCKAWCSMISFDPDFIKAHFRVTNPECKHKITITMSRIPHDVRPYTYFSHVCLDETNVYPAFHDDTVLNTYFEVLASYNGILLVGIGDKNRDHYLWNPTTGSYKKLSSNFSHCIKDLRMYGLWFDFACSAFKVIRIVKTISRFLDEKTTVKIYNSGTDSWKMIEGFPYTVLKNQAGLVWNGSPHWIVASPDSRGVIILYFEEEKFKEIDLPVLGLDDIALLELYDENKINIAVSDGYLYLDVRYKAWVMKECGGSWLELTSEETFNKLNLYYQQLFWRASYFETPISPHIGTKECDE